MKKVTKILIAAMLLMCGFGYAQSNDEYEWKKPPTNKETVIGEVILPDPNKRPDSWQHRQGFENGGGYYSVCNKGKHKGEFGTDKSLKKPKQSEEECYFLLLKSAQNNYGGGIALRNFKIKYEDTPDYRDSSAEFTKYKRTFIITASVVVKNIEAYVSEKLPEVLDKAMRNVRPGARMAIDQITGSVNIETHRNNIIDALLDKGYKVVAKEYLQKLYEEQQNQQSGIYNDNTTVQENNFSAVGYYINVKITNNSIRVQVVNVSTGEYEGNATVNF